MGDARVADSAELHDGGVGGDERLPAADELLFADLEVAGFAEFGEEADEVHQLGAAFARFEVDVTSPGQVKLLLNSTDGLTAWLDANPIKLEHEMLLELPIGRHRITFAIELSQREMPLRVEMADVLGSNTKVQLVSGK